MDHSALIRTLAAVAGRNNVSDRQPDRVAYAADMWPRAQIWKAGGEPARFPPDAVVWVDRRELLCDILRTCHAHGLTVIPYGAGSGVCGGTLPVRGGVIVDVKRMERVLELDHESRLVTVEAGRIGQQLEEDMNEAGFTVGHFPSSIYCSTVGGYVAARSAGQFSSRYGTFEDIARELTVALPDGRLVRTGPRATGLDWTPIFFGNEGTLGVVVDATLRLHPLPETRVFRGFRMPTVEMGMVAMRRLMQAGLQPCVLRLYDPFDTLIAASEPPPEAAADESRAGSPLGSRFDRWLLERIATLRHDMERGAVQLLLARPALLNRLADRLPMGSLLVIGFEGSAERVARESAAAFQLLEDAGGDDRGPGPGEAWYHHRYAVSFKQSKVFMAGAFVDTMEVSATWDRLPRLYRAVREAATPLAFLMAHFSHAYREGCSIYFTMAGQLGDPREAAALHKRLWKKALTAVVGAGASVSHHHGVGLAKRSFLAREYGPDGARVFDRLKARFDPDGRMNPGKLWPRPPKGKGGNLAEKTERPRTSAVVEPVEPLSRVVRAGGAATFADLETALERQGFRPPWWVAPGAAGRTLSRLLAETVTLDWGPSLGGLATNLLAIDGISSEGERITQTPAPRRAAGPDLPRLFVGSGGRWGEITSVVLRVTPRETWPVCATWRADTVAPLLGGLRRLLVSGLAVGRVALRVTGEDAPIVALLLDRQASVEARSLAESLGLTWATRDADARWPGALTRRGYRDALPLPWAKLASTLQRAAEQGVPVLAGRWSCHGAWLAPGAAVFAERLADFADWEPPTSLAPFEADRGEGAR